MVGSGVHSQACFIAMLPDILPVKRELKKKLDVAFKQRVNAYMGAINEAPRYFIKEGRRTVMIRPDGRIDETELKQSSAEVSIRFDEVPHLTLEARMAKLDDAAKEMAEQISTHAFSVINEAVERVGNVVNSGGRPLDPEAVLEVFEKIHLEFDDEGNLGQLTIAVPPGRQQHALEVMERIGEIPEYSRRYKEIIDKKRMEWRDQEASRKLVG